MLTTPDAAPTIFRKVGPIVIGAAATAATLPILLFGMPGGNDMVQHYEFAGHAAEALSTGAIYPSFSGASNAGLGDVGLRFYPPLAYYILGVSYLIAGSWFWASVLTVWSIFAAGAAGVYFWGRQWLDERAALAAAVIFTFAPYHLNEIYNNFLFAEFAAVSVLPFCFLFVTKLCSETSRVSVLGLASAYAFLLLANLPIAILGSICLFIYALALCRRTLPKRIAGLAAGVALALVLSAFYWVRMITELAWVKHSSERYFSGIWSFDANYLFSLKSFSIGPDDLSLWLGNLILAGSILLVVPTAVMFYTLRNIPRATVAVLTLAVISAFMTTPLSSPIWNNIPLLSRVQFPWRWLALVTLFGAVAAAPGLWYLSDRMKRSRNLLVPIGLAACMLVFVFVSAFVVRGASYTSPAELERLAGGFSLGETFEGWWPVWAQRSALNMKADVEAAGRPVTVRRWDAVIRELDIDAGKPSEIAVRTFYYPHWRATVNNVETSVESSADGTIGLAIPAETSSVLLQFREPAIVIASYVVSGVAWACLLVALSFSFWRRRPAAA